MHPADGPFTPLYWTETTFAEREIIRNAEFYGRKYFSLVRCMHVPSSNNTRKRGTHDLASIIPFG